MSDFWIVCQWAYWIGFVLLMIVHMISGSFTHMALLKRRGKVLLRFPGLFGALAMSLLWPLILPFQLAQGDS